MVDIINLNKRRKAKKRIEKDKKSAENRIKFGRTKNEKRMEQKENERSERFLNNHKLEKEEKE